MNNGKLSWRQLEKRELPLFFKKFEMVKEYLAESWGIDIDKLHKIVQEREQKIGDLDLGTL